MQTISSHANAALKIAKSSGGKITVGEAIRLVARSEGVSASSIGKHLSERSKFVRRRNAVQKPSRPTPLSKAEQAARDFYAEFTKQRKRGWALAQEMLHRRTFALTGQTDW